MGVIDPRKFSPNTHQNIDESKSNKAINLF